MKSSFVYPMSLCTAILAVLINFSTVTASSDGVDSLNVQLETKEDISIEQVEDIFPVLSASALEEGAEILFSIDHSVYDKLKDHKVVVKYQTDVNSKRIKKGFEGVDWLYKEVGTGGDHKVSLTGLQGNEKYVLYLGIIVDGDLAKIKSGEGDVMWSSKMKVKTERGWGIAKLLILIGSLGLFIYGMKIMSDGLQQSAGGKLRKMLSSITSNRVSGVLTGFTSTAIVQSSSITTVMTVSLVNAGLLTLRQSAGVMMGANIGTTITAWLVLLLGFKVSVSSYALMIIAIGAPLLFMSFKKAKAMSGTIIGFAILFIGLGYLKDAVPSLSQDSPLVQFFIDYKSMWYGPIMFVFLGTLVTVIVQSSSAAMALTMTMVAKGIIPYEVACAMVLGENIGTTITAELASIVGNVHAKRSARIHSLFNIVGVTWMLILYPFVLDLIAVFIDGDPTTNAEAANTGIAIFHSGFNLLNVLVLIWFVPQLVSFAERSVKSKGASDEDYKLSFIGGAIAATADLSVLEARKELAHFGKLTGRMSGYIQELMFTQDKKHKTVLYNKIQKYEEITDRVEIEVTTYLEKVAQGEMSEEASVHVRSMLRISTNLERIGDIFYRISKTVERKEEEKIWFSPEQREGVKSMLGLIDEAMLIMRDNLNGEYNSAGLQKAVDKEREINNFRNELRRAHHESFQKPEYSIEGGMIFIDIISSLEKIGDHIINVSEAVAGEY